MGNDINTVTDDDGTPVLHVATKQNQPMLVQTLLDLGVTTKNVDLMGYTAAVSALLDSENISTTVLDVLRINGCFQKEGDARMNEDLLLGYCRRQSYWEVEELLKQGVDPDFIDRNNRISPLYEATKLGDKKLVELLLQYKANVNYRTPRGSALRIASTLGDALMVESLLFAGADTDIMASLECACLSQQSEIVDLIIDSELIEEDVDQIGDSNSESNSALHFAVLMGDEVLVKKLTRFDFLMKHSNKMANSPLHLATLAKNESMVKLLLECGVNVDSQGENGDTALHIASKHGLCSICKSLIQYAADVDMQNANRQSALHLACIYRNYSVAEELLRNRAKTDVSDINGWYPIHIALTKKATHLVELLLSYNASVHLERIINPAGMDLTEMNLLYADAFQDILKPSAKSDDIMFMACINGFVDILSLLIVHVYKGNVNGITDFAENSLLHAAAEWGQDKIVATLINYGVDINCKNRFGYTPLHVVSTQLIPSIDVILILLENGASVNSVDTKNQTVLYKACKRGKERLVEELLNNPYTLADPDIGDLNGVCPLHLAAKKGHVGIVKLLLKSNASVNKTDRNGMNALFFCKTTEAASVLLEKGILCDSRDFAGRSALLIQAYRNNKDVLQILAKEGGHAALLDKLGRNLLHYFVSGTANAVELQWYIENLTLDVNSTDINGQSALHLSVMGNKLEHVKVLLQAEANVNLQDKCGITPLHLSTDPDIYDTLKNNGANLNLRTASGCTAEEMVTHRKQVQESLMLTCSHRSTFLFENEEVLPELQQITEAVTAFMDDLASQSGALNPMMNFKPMLAGSVSEQTKVILPNEMDFLCRLTKVAPLVGKPEQTFQRAYTTLCFHPHADDSIADIKGQDGHLQTIQLLRHFYGVLSIALEDPDLWRKHGQLYREVADDITGLNEKISALNLIWHGNKYKWLNISVDIVPAIGIENWYAQGCTNEAKDFNCFAVAKNIRHAPEDMKTKLLQLSFTKCETNLMLSVKKEMRQGYMLAKVLKHIACSKGNGTKVYVTSFMMKNAMFQLIKENNFTTEVEKCDGDTPVEYSQVTKLILEKLQNAFTEDRLLLLHFLPDQDILCQYLDHSSTDNFDWMNTALSNVQDMLCLLKESS